MNPSHVEITDADTHPDDIICRIEPQPSFGYLENISPLPGSEKSRAGDPITDFRASDLPEEFINYVQDSVAKLFLITCIFTTITSFSHF